MQNKNIKKNIILLLMSAFIILTIFFYFQKINVITTSITPTPLVEILEVVSLPQKILIPKIGVETDIEEVGLTKNGKMGIPEISSNVGWYNLGTIPGAKGNAVMAGHLNNFLGLPLVFWKLDELEIGDDIYVVAEDGTNLQFKVTGKALYDYDSIETEAIFGPTDGKHLNLITCNGIWVQDIKNYNKRLVIFSEAV
jgi:sortase A